MLTCKGLKKQFEQSGLSQNKFALLLGIDKSELSRILNGLRSPSSMEICKMCEALGCQPCDVIEWEG